MFQSVCKQIHIQWSECYHNDSDDLKAKHPVRLVMDCLLFYVRMSATVSDTPGMCWAAKMISLLSAHIHSSFARSVRHFASHVGKLLLWYCLAVGAVILLIHPSGKCSLLALLLETPDS